jgi:hypothetical protein
MVTGARRRSGHPPPLSLRTKCLPMKGRDGGDAHESLSPARLERSASRTRGSEPFPSTPLVLTD